MTGHLEVFGPGPGQFIFLGSVWMLTHLWITVALAAGRDRRSRRASHPIKERRSKLRRSSAAT